MKKILCVALAAFMLFSLTACGGKEVGGSLKDNKGDSVKSEEAFKLGSTEGSTYENEFLGLGFNIPDGWGFYDEKQIAELNGWAAEHMDPEDVESMENAEGFYDLFTHAPDQTASANIVFQKGTITQVATTDLEEFAEEVLDGVEETYESMGYDPLEDEVEKITVDGKKYHGYRLVTDINGSSYYQVGFFIKKGSYLVTVSLGANSEEKLQSIIDSFYHL